MRLHVVKLRVIRIMKWSITLKNHRVVNEAGTRGTGIMTRSHSMQ